MGYVVYLGESEPPKTDGLPPLDWEKGVVLAEKKLREALAGTWTGLPLWVKEVDGRKAGWYVFGGSPEEDTHRIVPGRLLRYLLRDLKTCRIEEIRLNGSLEIKWTNEGGLPGRARIRFSYPGRMKDWKKVANIPLKEVIA